MERWQRCPSTHCERWQECRAPHECIIHTHEKPELLLHVTPDPDACKHNFKGWREFEDGNGGETVCDKCGMGAMTYSLRTGF
jgi:hypothetical protein